MPCNAPRINSSSSTIATIFFFLCIGMVASYRPDGDGAIIPWYERDNTVRQTLKRLRGSLLGFESSRKRQVKARTARRVGGGPQAAAM